MDSSARCTPVARHRQGRSECPTAPQHQPRRRARPHSACMRRTAAMRRQHAPPGGRQRPARVPTPPPPHPSPAARLSESSQPSSRAVALLDSGVRAVEGRRAARVLRRRAARDDVVVGVARAACACRAFGSWPAACRPLRLHQAMRAARGPLVRLHSLGLPQHATRHAYRLLLSRVPSCGRRPSHLHSKAARRRSCWCSPSLRPCRWWSRLSPRWCRSEPHW